MKPAQPPAPPVDGEAYVYAVFAARTEKAGATINAIGVSAPTVPIRPGATSAEIDMVLVYTIYFHNPKPRTHTVRLVHRTEDWQVALIRDLEPLEMTDPTNLQIRVEPIAYNFPAQHHYVCLEIDERMRWFSPVWVLPVLPPK